METIMQYIESMFKGLPETAELIHIKSELKNNMEDKYEELKKEGKSENEAIGIVISEFGNIDELLQEMGIEPDTYSKKDCANTLSLDDVHSYLSFSHQFGKNIALGVLLILTGVSLLIFVGGMSGSSIAIVPLFLALIPAIALFIYSGMKNGQYTFIEKGDFQISASTKKAIENEYAQKKDIQIKTVIFSVCLFILSPVLLIVTASWGTFMQFTSVSVMILVIGVGVYMIIRFCTPLEFYKKILKLGQYSESVKKAEKIIGAVAGAVWPFATAVYLFLGFLYQLWGVAWVIFPILGVLFGAFSALVHALVDEKK